MPVSSTIQASMGPCLSMQGSTSSRTLPNTAMSDQGASPTRCRSDWCLAETRVGATIRRHRLDALAFAGHQQPDTIIVQGLGPIGVPDHFNKSLDIGGKTRLAGSPGEIHIKHRVSIIESPSYQICPRRESPSIL